MKKNVFITGAAGLHSSTPYSWFGGGPGAAFKLTSFDRKRKHSYATLAQAVDNAPAHKHSVEDFDGAWEPEQAADDEVCA